MYVWSENIAGRGGQEIASCMRKHLANYIPANTKRVILYSDCCGGQNRNIKITLLLKHFLANSSIELLEENFFLSGHSYNSCDRNFGLIEKERKLHETVSTPDEWIKIIKETKKNPPIFEVTRMQSSDFFSSNELQKLIVNRKVDVEKEKINWMKIRTIKLDKKNPFFLYILHDDGILHEVSIEKKNTTAEQFKDVKLSHLYPNGRTITNKKYEDLMQLVKYIDQKDKPFYQQLRTNVSTRDYDFASGDSDDE